MPKCSVKVCVGNNREDGDKEGFLQCQRPAMRTYSNGKLDIGLCEVHMIWEKSALGEGYART